MFSINKVVLCIAACFGAVSANAISASNIEWDAGFRLRHQQLQGDWKADSVSSTLLARISADWQASSAVNLFTQYDHVWALDKDDYNSVTFWNARAPLPDVPGGELNQLYLNWQINPEWNGQLGRQAISFDNERHVGNVAFWQNDQTFDALSFKYRDGFAWQAQYSYVTKVHRIFGNRARTLLPPNDTRLDANPLRPARELGNHQHNTHLLNVQYRVNPFVSVSGFAYLIDNDSAPAVSSNTFGLRVEGSAKPDTIKYRYTVELAHQQDAANNPNDYWAVYGLVELGAQFKSHRFDVGWERLGDNNGVAFSTSLGTNHKFQGWVDVFSQYNAVAGIDDRYVSYAGRDGRLRWKLVFHQFDSLNDNRDLGTEWDAEIGWRFARDWEAKFMGGAYQTDQGSELAPASRFDMTTWMLSIAYNL